MSFGRVICFLYKLLTLVTFLNRYSSLPKAIGLNTVEDIVLDNNSKILEKPTYFAVCALFRNQARYLAEWVAYHTCIGVGHFYLYNDRSIDNFECALRPYIQNGTVTLFHTKMENAAGPQLRVYEHCLAMSKKIDTRWTAFIDIDEFLYWDPKISMEALLDKFKDFSALQLSWVHFVSERLQIFEEQALVLETYTLREKLNRAKVVSRKSIVYARNVSKMNVHHPNLIEGAFCTDESRTVLESCVQVGPVRAEEIYLHHYSTKSYNYFQCKALTPHAKRPGNPYRYGGKTLHKALKKIKYIYLAQINNVKRHSEPDYSILKGRKSCLNEKLKINGSRYCDKIKCWCKHCTDKI